MDTALETKDERFKCELAAVDVADESDGTWEIGRECGICCQSIFHVYQTYYLEFEVENHPLREKGY